ncbi:MAG: hypothetical protein EBZ69_01665 [Alphaproteobacteria bacterium]|nr:hypothetical protein [Alphaproteobacteria bacterium]NDC95460.1 hypothetical protein [bacterium]NDG31623.1 hypothetical protein [bacterium]
MNRILAKPACVFLMKRNGLPYRWIVKTTVNRERVYLGCFKTKEEAVKAWKKHLGESKHGKHT